MTSAVEKLSRSCREVVERLREAKSLPYLSFFGVCIKTPRFTSRNANFTPFSLKENTEQKKKNSLFSTTRELCRNRRNPYPKIRNCRTHTLYLSGTADNYAHIVEILTQKSGIAVIRNCRCATSSLPKILELP